MVYLTRLTIAAAILFCLCIPTAALTAQDHPIVRPLPAISQQHSNDRLGPRTAGLRKPVVQPIPPPIVSLQESILDPATGNTQQSTEMTQPDSNPGAQVISNDATQSEMPDANVSTNADLFDGGQFEDTRGKIDVGVNFIETDTDFSRGLVIKRKDVAMKIGGYVKADYIYDFNPIDSTDAFDVTTIPIGAPPRTNSRFHARQSRINADTRWKTCGDVIRVFVEGDFFSTGDQLRLRHAYGEWRNLIIGRTWTTFGDPAALPATLDFEGSVAAVNSRRAQLRWKTNVWHPNLTWAMAFEDSVFLLDIPEGFLPSGVSIRALTESPDFVTRLRWSGDALVLQGAVVARQLGIQDRMTGFRIDKLAGGANFTSVLKLTQRDKFYSEILYGNGIGSFRSLPDAAPTVDGGADLLGTFAWMIGFTHEWNEQLSSNITYAENHIRASGGRPSNGLNNIDYVAMNLIWSPRERVEFGIEYLNGKRENFDGQSGIANRIQMAFTFYLP